MESCKCNIFLWNKMDINIIIQDILIYTYIYICIYIYSPLYSSYSIVVALASWSLAEIYQLCPSLEDVPLYLPKSVWWILDCMLRLYWNLGHGFQWNAFEPIDPLSTTSPRIGTVCSGWVRPYMCLRLDSVQKNGP